MNHLQIMNHNDVRVLTTAQIASAYGSDARRISENFNRNKDRYSEGKHYFALEGREKRDFLNHTQIEDGSRNAVTLYLWTEKGAWMHAKSLNTDQAWDAYEMLVDDYYKVKGVQSTVQALDKDAALAIVLRKTADVMEKLPQFESRLEKIENNTTVEHGQMLTIKDAASRAVTSALGGRKSESFRDKRIRSRAYQELWRDYKDYFNINSYHNTLKKDFEKALSHIKGWKPTGGLLREVENTNRQMAFLGE